MSDAKEERPHKHYWTPIYDKEGEIVGRICTECGEHQGRWG